MRLVFGTILVLAGLIGTTTLTRLLSRQTREFSVEGILRLVRIVAMIVVPIGALMIVSSAVRMIGAGQVGVRCFSEKSSRSPFTRGSTWSIRCTTWWR